MHKSRTLSLITGVLLMAVPAQRASAQNADSVLNARADDVLQRIRKLTSSDVASARLLADSLVTSLPANSGPLPAALFAKASIAPSAAEAERDYGRIVNEYRFAVQVPDALMRLALLESARNNRTGALRHLDRLLRDHSDSPVRSRASLLAGRLRMDANDVARSCELLAAAYASAGATERDVRDQAEVIGKPCPTPVAQMAQRDPPPMGVMRAKRDTVVTAVVAAPVAGTRRSRRDSTVAAQRAAAVAKKDSLARVVVPPAPAPAPVVKRDTAPTPKPVVAAAPRDTTPKPAPVVVAPVVKRDTAPAPAPVVVAPVVKRDTAPTPKPAAPVASPVVKRDTAPTPKPAAPVAAPVVKRDTAPTPKPATVVAAPVVKRDTTPTPKPVVTAPTPTPASATPAVAPSTTPAPSAAGVRYGVQFAAYNDRPGAEQYASVLRARGITARVEGASAPFRVRAGRFTTRAEAEASAALWRRPGTAAIVVTLSPTP